MSYSRNEIKEWIGSVEDDLAAFVGADLDVAHLVATVRKAYNEGEISREQAESLLESLQRLWRLIELGRKFGRWVRNPPAEVELLVLTRLRRNNDDDGR